MKKNNTSHIAQLVALFLFVTISNSVNAQFSPAKSDTLNFSSILFEFPWVDGANSYEISVLNQSGKGNLTAVSEANKLVLNGLNFGDSYTWKVRGVTAIGEKLPWSHPIPFHIATSDYIDPNKFRYDGKKLDRSKSSRSLILLDYGRVAINKVGKPVWFLPKTDSLFNQLLIRDLKMTQSGTFTAIFGESAIEFDRKGTILWTAPDDGRVNGEAREHYHHEFTKLPNGNYLVLGQDHVKRRVPHSNDSLEIEFGTVIEYNPEGRIVWSWNSNDYFTDADLFSRKNGDRYNTRSHMNAATMYNNEVYVGFRDISRIVVIDKKTKKVIESYGAPGGFSEPHAAVGFFRRQHDALRLSDGNMAVLNNDSIMDPSVVSSVVVFSRMQQGNSEKLLDFKLNFDELTNGKSAKTGNVNELPDGNLMVNCGDLNRFIELTRSGEVVWSMFAEQYDRQTGAWKAFPQYRIFPTPSLYPYVFTSKLIKNTFSKRKREIEVKIFNVGSEPDEYTISLKKGNRTIEKYTCLINSESSENSMFQQKKKRSYTIEIYSSKLDEFQRVEIPGFE